MDADNSNSVDFTEFLQFRVETVPAGANLGLGGWQRSAWTAAVRVHDRVTNLRPLDRATMGVAIYQVRCNNTSQPAAQCTQQRRGMV